MTETLTPEELAEFAADRAKFRDAMLKTPRVIRESVLFELVKSLHGDDADILIAAFTDKPEGGTKTAVFTTMQPGELAPRARELALILTEAEAAGIVEVEPEQDDEAPS